MGVPKPKPKPNGRALNAVAELDGSASASLAEEFLWSRESEEEYVSAACALPRSSGEESPTEEWLEDWQERVSAWWLGVPSQDGVSACLGALGVHLASRLDAAYRAWAMLRGQHVAPSVPPPAVEARCEWIANGEGAGAQLPQLPDFPDFPSEFELPSLVPIPRLLPRDVLLDASSFLRSGLHENTPVSGSAAASQPVRGLALGFSLGAAGGLSLAALLLARAHTCRRRGRAALRTKQTLPRQSSLKSPKEAVGTSGLASA